MPDWAVYILRCVDGSLYTGISVDVERRVEEHNSCNRLGAKYTRGRRPVKLVYTEVLNDRSQATQRELQIKQMSHKEKERLIRSADVKAK